MLKYTVDEGRLCYSDDGDEDGYFLVRMKNRIMFKALLLWRSWLCSSEDEESSDDEDEEEEERRPYLEYFTNSSNNRQRGHVEEYRIPWLVVVLHFVLLLNIWKVATILALATIV